MASDLTLGVILGATVKSGFDSAFGRASKSVGELGKTVKQTHAQLGQVKSYQRNIAALDTTRGKLGETQRKVMELRRSMSLAGDNPKLARQLETTKGKAVKLSASLEQQRTKLRQQGDALRRSGIDTRDLNSVSEQLTRTYDQQKQALGQLYATQEKRKRLMGELRGQMVKLGSTILFGRKAIGGAIDFESAMADVRKVVDFDSPEQFQKMGQDIDALSRKLPMARDGIAAIVAAGGQAGIMRNELVGFAQDAVKMGVAFDMSADDAGTVMAKWRTGLQLTQSQAASLGDVVNYLSNTMAATPVEIATIVKEVGPFAKTAGLSANNVAALGASMVAMGADSSVASTSLRRMFINLTAGDAATASQQKAFAKLGMTSSEVAQSMQQDAKGTIVNVLQQIKRLPKTDQASMITQLFGAHAVQAVAPLLNNMDALQQAFHDAGTESRFAGSMQKEYLSRVTTTSNALQLAKNAWTSITGVLGKVFLPTIKVLVGQFIRFADVFVNVADRFPHLTALVVSATTAFLGFKTAVIGGKWLATFLPNLGKFSGLLKAVVPGAGMAQKAILGMSGAMKAFNLSMLMSPVGLIFGAIAAAVVVGALVIRKYWDPIKAFFNGLWKGISEAAGPVFDSIGEAMAPLKPLWDGFVDILSKVWDWFGKLLTPVKSTQDQLDKATGAGETFGRALGGAFKIITWPMRTAIQLVGLFGQSWRGAIDGVRSLWDGLKAQISAIVGWITSKIDWIVNKWKSVKGTVGGVWSKITAGDKDDTPGKPKARRGVIAGAMIGATFMTPAMAAQPENQPAARASHVIARAAQKAGSVDRSTHTNTTHAPITIHAAPGMDAREVGQEVRRALDERDRQRSARRRSALEDLD